MHTIAIEMFHILLFTLPLKSHVVLQFQFLSNVGRKFPSEILNLYSDLRKWTTENKTRFTYGHCSKDIKFFY